MIDINKEMEWTGTLLLCIANVMAFTNIFNPRIGSIFSSVQSKDYNDVLVYGDAFSVLIVLFDMFVLYAFVKVIMHYKRLSP